MKISKHDIHELESDVINVGINLFQYQLTVNIDEEMDKTEAETIMKEIQYKIDGFVQDLVGVLVKLNMRRIKHLDK